MSVSVLLIEDDAANLTARRNLLRTFDGCGTVVGVRDPDSALHMLRSLPRFDLVVADIDLSQTARAGKNHNKAGVAVARWLKDSRYPTFVAGYSSFFSGDEISDGERAAFDDIVDRSVDGQDLDDKLESWIANASGGESNSSLRQLLFEAYASSSEDTKETGGRPSTVPVVSLDTLIDYESEELEEIRASGFSLSLLLPDVDDEIRKAIPIWIKRADAEVAIEVVGQPYLYATGSSEDEAKEALKALILGYHEDLQGKESDDELGAYVKIMFRFLGSLF